MNLLGTIYFLLFIILVALGGVGQAHMSQKFSPIAFLMVSSFQALVVFVFMSYKQSGLAFYYKAKNQKKNILLLNIANLFGWGCYMYAIKYLEPAIGVIIANASGPILVIVLSKILNAKHSIYRAEKIAAIGISLSLAFVIFSSLLGKSALVNAKPTHLILGIFLAFLAGIAQVLFSLFSKTLNENNFLPIEILVWRFPLIFIVCFFLIDLQTIQFLIHSFSSLFWVLFLSFFGLVIPIYFYQKAVKLIDPIYIAVLYILEPVIMFIGQLFDPRLKASFYSYLGVGFIVFFSLISIAGRYYSLKKIKRKNKMLNEQS